MNKNAPTNQLPAFSFKQLRSTNGVNMSSPFHTTFDRSFRLKYLFLICPFSVHSNHTAPIRLYATLHILGFAVAFVVSFSTMLPFFLGNGKSITIGLNQMLSNAYVCGVLLASQLQSVARRHRHLAVIRQIGRLFDSIAGVARMPARNYRRLIATNALLALANFVVIATMSLALEMKEWCIIPYQALFAYVMTYMLGIVLHVQDLLIIVGDIGDAYSDGLRRAAAGPELRSKVLAVLDQLGDVMRGINACFGVHLGLVLLQDVLVMANCFLYVVELVLTLGEQRVWFKGYYMVSFVLPMLVRMVVQSAICGRVGGKIDRLHWALVRRWERIDGQCADGASDVVSTRNRLVKIRQFVFCYRVIVNQLLLRMVLHRVRVFLVGPAPPQAYAQHIQPLDHRPRSVPHQHVQHVHGNH